MARMIILCWFLALASPAFAATVFHDDGIDLCMHRPDRAADASHRREGWIIPDEPLTDPCPPSYRPVHRANHGLY